MLPVAVVALMLLPHQKDRDGNTKKKETEQRCRGCCINRKFIY